LYKILGSGILILILIIFTSNTQLKVKGSTDEVQGNILASPQSKENITITVLFAGPNETGKSLVESAANKLRSASS
jgi:hypothetical protein